MIETEHVIFRTAFRRYVEQELAPRVPEWEADRLVPPAVWREFGARGYLCPWLPEEYGGSGADFRYSVIIAEELARAGAVGFMAPLHSDIVVPYLYDLGTPAQRARWLPGCASGEIITAIAMTEPNAGSDLASLKTHAEREGDGWVLNGAKTFISNGINAHLVVVAARTDRAAPPARGISLFAVEAGTPGFCRGRKLDKAGLHAQDTAELFFDDCRLPADALLGEEGRGFYALMTHLQQERLVCAVIAQAMAEAMLDLTLGYVRERQAFGRPVGSFQHNAFKLVELATEVKLGRAFLDGLVDRHVVGAELVTEVSMAKAWIAEMANRVAYHGVQLHGGYGYMEEYAIARFARDVRPFAIFAGTTEVMKQIVAKDLGLA